MSINGEKIVALHSLHAELHVLLAHYFTGYILNEPPRPLHDETGIAQTIDVMIEVLEQKIKKVTKQFEDGDLENVVVVDFKKRGG